MNQEKKNGNSKKPYLLVDSSYVSFHRFFSTLIWYNNVYPDEEIDDDYDWLENKVFMKHFDETYMKNLLKFKNMYNIPYENMIVVRDCPRETIWRMNIYPEYKANRKNTCSYKNKKYNIGNIFKHIYNNLYPQLEKQYGFKILKVDNAEADDIIAVLAIKIRELDKSRLVVIISNDNDYLQLVNEKTLIWSLQNKLLNTKVETTAEEILIRKILKGDDSDNIPSLVGNMSERELSEIIRDSVKLENWFNINPEKREMYMNNRQLIDFQYIPESIRKLILDECKDIFPEQENEVKKVEKIEKLEIKIEVEPEIKTVSNDAWKNNPVIKIKTKQGVHEIKNNNFQYFQKYKTPIKTYYAPYMNYRNYGNNYYGQYNYYNQNNYGYQPAYKSSYINLATEDYYNY